jgi:hypothetical protein
MTLTNNAPDGMVIELDRRKNQFTLYRDLEATGTKTCQNSFGSCGSIHILWGSRFRQSALIEDMAYSAADFVGVVHRDGGDPVQAVLAEAFGRVPRIAT